MEIKLCHHPPWLFNYKIQKDSFSLHLRMHKKVSIFYDDKHVDTKGITTKIIDRVKETCNSELGRKNISYEGGKGLFTAGSLPRNKLQFTVVLEVMSSNRRRLLVRQSFFHINTKKNRRFGLWCFGWRGLRTSFLATQSGSSLNIANYLDIESLLDLTCQTAASVMKDKTLDEIRKNFHIKNDYTKEEEEEVRRGNSWAFE